MAQTTEAACLLQSGAMYSRRIGFKTAAGQDIFAGVKPGGVSIYFGDAPIYHFDLEGRWQRAFVEGVHYLKGLSPTVQSIDRDREPSGMVLRRKTLPYGLSVDLDASIRSAALDLIGDLDSGRLNHLETPTSAKAWMPGEFREFLERVASWDSAAWFAHRERYLGTYGPMPFLPPDCPNALVLQATLGHSDGRAFGRAAPFEHYIRSTEEFEEHSTAVKKLVGRGISQFSGIFLAGSDVLHRPTTDLLGYFETIRRLFASEKTEGPGHWDDSPLRLGQIHTFLDDLEGDLPDFQTWSSLADLGLSRVNLGIESADPSIRSDFGKRWDNDSLGRLITEVHQAGIKIGLLILIGAGGRKSLDKELSATQEWLDSLPLERTDLVTLIDLRFFDISSPDDLDPLTDDDVASQVSALKAWSSSGGPSKRPKVVAYNPDKQMT